LSFILLASFCHLSCDERRPPTFVSTKTTVPAKIPVRPIPNHTKKELFLKNTYWIDSLLKHYSIDRRIVKNYLTDTCTIKPFSPNELKVSSEGLRQLGYIRKNKKKVNVFVLPSLTICEEGESYYFSDASLPRLYVDTYCCHPENIFVTDDIDEDGINEIVEYYSPCAGRFAALRVWTLKNNEWEEAGAVTYDLHYTEIPIQKRIRKTKKGHFQLLLLTAESITVFGNNGRWMDLSIK